MKAPPETNISSSEIDIGVRSIETVTNLYKKKYKPRGQYSVIKKKVIKSKDSLSGLAIDLVGLNTITTTAIFCIFLKKIVDSNFNLK